MPMLRHRRRRRIEPGGTYTTDELARGEVELVEVERRPEPPVELQGEPWGWTKDGGRPEGWRADGRYGPQDGEDERRRAGENYEPH